ncbi:MAG: hypothetical protein HY849_06435 [Nitrosomonadales bacterium]|nr:hypothetical protein [Nitrosomonadales bacterium]
MRIITNLVAILLIATLLGCKEEKPAVVEKPTYTLGMTIEQFVNNLNSKQSDFLIQNAQLTKKDSSDGFLYLNHQFNNNSILVGVINEKDHSVRSITIIQTVSGRDNLAQMKAAMNIPLLISLTIQSLNPTIDKTAIGPQVVTLFGSATTTADQMHSYILNGNNYSLALSSADKAYVFSAAPVNLPKDQ